ncbi:PucR family transcriptional regulator [Cryobacterium psychrophilum]|uniref:PucR family transcriptional regulator n=1 Tax=Cryobacterium psychrophilum TaxID=41988 RepID=A0A4Y8KQ79_9MICO|nr:PucR family transcriptional regulator [Cryobacterium psychrophilum]TDW29345.1 DNA-binding PucR family transcriptional regulator [Cryobacterium psychrophilum]TFD80014.1 PucR family transcriptional regulator [Cryobacterium psychrophilum]
MQAADIDQAVAIIAARLGRALSLEDLDGLLLAYSAHVATADRVRTNFLLSKMVPPDVGAWQLSHGIATAVKPVPVPANAELEMLGRVCVPLLARGFRVGYLWVLQLDDEHAPDAILQELRMIRPEMDSLAEMLLNRTSADSDGRRLREAQFVAACRGDREAVVGVGGWPGVHGRGPWRLATLLVRGENPSDPVESGLLQRLSALHATLGINTVLFSAGTETHAVLLLQDAIGGEDETEILRRFGREVARRSGQPASPALLGLSEPFSDLRRLPRAYAEARSAVQAAWVDGQLGALVSFRAIGVYQFLAVEGRDVSPGESTLFSDLRELDRNEELLPVLELLYDKDGSVAEVAEQLHLHRTSIYNRLGRIRALIGVDALGGHARLELHLALKADRWAGRPRL